MSGKKGEGQPLYSEAALATGYSVRVCNVVLASDECAADE
jgi:hypothetical protein